jgi:hypothetical protein
MSVVRSRAFAGPYSPGTFLGFLAKFWVAATVALGYSFVVGGAGAYDQAVNSIEFVLLYLISSEIIGPRITKARRWAVCPMIDMLNHDGNLGGSDIAYEYFSDTFTVTLDPADGPVEVGSECFISYGPRTNDVLLQYYGFVQPNNPHDVYAMDVQELILRIDGVKSLPSGAVSALTGLVEMSAPVTLTPNGADAVALRVARLLMYPDLAVEAKSGCEELSNASAETEVKRRLALVAKAALADLPETHENSMVQAFVQEKRRVLGASAAALEA